MKIVKNLFEEMVAIEQVFDAWLQFRGGKRQRADVQKYERHLERNLFRLQRELASGTYEHQRYASFYIQDPKVRHIRKACVRDRIVHQLLYNELVRVFEPRFIHNLYSSRIGKGTHQALDHLRCMTWKVSKNLCIDCWGLKCDVRKFYDSVDHEVLLSLLKKTIHDEAANCLLETVIRSFHVEETPGKGMPIGNLTSQVFTNIYLNEFDQFVKHKLKVKYYLRYADDMLFLSPDKGYLEEILPQIQEFLKTDLFLELHPKKIILRPLHQGIDFLGYVMLPHHKLLRTKTKRRMKRKLLKRLYEYQTSQIGEKSLSQTMQSYLGVLSHANAYRLQEEIRNRFSWG